MDDTRVREVLAGEEAWVVGGAVRDALLGRPVLDLDVACSDPREAAHRYAQRFGGAVFPLSDQHGAWRVVKHKTGYMSDRFWPDWRSTTQWRARADHNKISIPLGSTIYDLSLWSPLPL